MNELYDKLNEIALRDAEITEIELPKPMNTKEPGELLQEALQNEETMLEVGRLATEEQKAVLNTKEQLDPLKVLEYKKDEYFTRLFNQFSMEAREGYPWTQDGQRMIERIAELRSDLFDFIRETREQAYQKGLDDGYDEGFRACERGVTP